MFSAAFLAATVLPFYSEVILYTLIGEGQSLVLLLLVATAGNTLGSLVNWYLGRRLLDYRDRRWFFVSEKQITRGEWWFGRYGYWMLLLAWMPLGGDALPVVAGFLRVPLWKAAPLIAVGKAVRYVVIAWLAV